MNIDWLNFTPWTSLAGGVLIGLAATLLVLFKGRVMGVSGIVSGIRISGNQDVVWRIAFVLGIILAPWIYQIFSPFPESVIDTSWVILILAGVLTGYGTRLGSGCTSGHGVCGLSRLSLRSLVATVIFMFLGFVTVFIVRHLLG